MCRHGRNAQRSVISCVCWRGPFSRGNDASVRDRRRAMTGQRIREGFFQGSSCGMRLPGIDLVKGTAGNAAASGGGREGRIRCRDGARQSWCAKVLEGLGSVRRPAGSRPPVCCGVPSLRRAVGGTRAGTPCRAASRHRILSRFFSHIQVHGKRPNLCNILKSYGQGKDFRGGRTFFPLAGETRVRNACPPKARSRLSHSGSGLLPDAPAGRRFARTRRLRSRKLACAL